MNNFFQSVFVAWLLFVAVFLGLLPESRSGAQCPAANQVGPLAHYRCTGAWACGSGLPGLESCVTGTATNRKCPCYVNNCPPNTGSTVSCMHVKWTTGRCVGHCVALEGVEYWCVWHMECTWCNAAFPCAVAQCYNALDGGKCPNVSGITSCTILATDGQCDWTANPFM